MEILERGSTAWFMDVQCGSCKSKLRINTDDLRLVLFTSGRRIAVKCPVCRMYVIPNFPPEDEGLWHTARKNSEHEKKEWQESR